MSVLLPLAAPRIRRLAAVLLAGAAAGACGAESAGGARQPATPAAPLATTDSLVERALARLQARVGPAPAALANAEPTRDALARRYVAALSAADSATLGRLLITPAEFAHFYFPPSFYRRPPTALEPEVVWLQLQAGSARGASEALRAYGARALRYVGHGCADSAAVEGENRYWSGCVVRFVQGSGDAEQRLRLGRVMERGGRFKFVNYVGD